MLDNTADHEVQRVLGSLNDALVAGDAAGAAALFTEDSYWRDLVSFTWNIKTMEGRAAIADMLSSQLAAIKPSDWRIAEGEVCHRGWRDHDRLDQL